MGEDMEIILCAVQPYLAKAWREHISEDLSRTVRVVEGSILSLDVAAVVSPANSFGFMDGGLDALYAVFRSATPAASATDEPGNRLAVSCWWGRHCWWRPGTAHPLVHQCTDHARATRPGDGGAGLSGHTGCRALCFGGRVGVWAIPGMGTGVGGLHPQRAARAMMHAIHDVLFPRPFPASLAEVYAF